MLYARIHHQGRLLDTQSLRCFSSVLIQRDGSIWTLYILQQFLDAAHGFRSEKHIATERADFCRNVVNNDHLSMIPDSVDDLPLFILSFTSCKAALHCAGLLCVGVGHLGGMGS